MNRFTQARQSGRPLILDGAMGSLLQQYGVPAQGAAWTSIANITHPDLVLKIHRDYIASGADIITTNTFRTNPLGLIDSPGYTSGNLVKAAVSIARQAAAGKTVMIAGSNAPAEDCYRKERKISQSELEKNHSEHINLLNEAGCDFILNETQSHLDEIVFICRYCAENNILFVLSLFFDEDLKLLSGEDLDYAVSVVRGYAPLAIGFNCISQAAFSRVSKPADINWGAYLNCGSGAVTDPVITCGVSPEEYLEEVKAWLPFNPAFIGACCGSNAAHILQIKQYLNGLSRN